MHAAVTQAASHAIGRKQFEVQLTFAGAAAAAGCCTAAGRAAPVPAACCTRCCRAAAACCSCATGCCGGGGGLGAAATCCCCCAWANICITSAGGATAAAAGLVVALAVRFRAGTRWGGSAWDLHRGAGRHSRAGSGRLVQHSIAQSKRSKALSTARAAYLHLSAPIIQLDSARQQLPANRMRAQPAHPPTHPPTHPRLRPAVATSRGAFGSRKYIVSSSPICSRL